MRASRSRRSALKAPRLVGRVNGRTGTTLASVRRLRLGLGAVTALREPAGWSWCEYTAGMRQRGTRKNPCADSQRRIVHSLLEVVHRHNAQDKLACCVVNRVS